MEMKHITAIDIGTTKTVVLIAQIKESGQIEILGIGTSTSKGIKKGVVKNVEETVNSIEEAIEMATKNYDYELNNIFVGVTSHQIKTIFNKGSRYIENKNNEISADDVRLLIDEMNKISIGLDEEILEIIPQAYIIDGDPEESNPIGITANRLEADFKIITNKQISKIGIEKSLNRINLKYNQVFLNPVASAASVLSPDEIEAGVVLVDIGAGVTDVAIFYDNIVRHIAVIPFGGNVVTRDIKEGCQILLRDAELLKIQFGSAIGDGAPEDKVVSIAGINGRKPKEISFKSLAYIIQARIEEIAEQVAFEIEKSKYFDIIGAGIVVTGGGALLRNLDELLAFKTGMEVRIGIPFEDKFENLDIELQKPEFSTALGILIEASDYEDSLQAIKKAKDQTKPAIQNSDNDVEPDGKNVDNGGVLGFFKNLLTDKNMQ
ncbi:MAG: cell division protein FtsA [Bacteroidetes bacterium]|jgi:cell division protein FtsA|nr:cell division protein FtsA [Bacteroidota bacterium]MBT6684733.1 cell division protein FtsA [Bacteroidota bacterium]MBT7143834.1 cell division protein FtsA [Bacteroidota bacterium]MBT7489985.1 cell division protein FtsA [Bacteroidota bacterium]